jgi:TfoX/Sxy family transcriptional regulator of competence genes
MGPQELFDDLTAHYLGRPEVSIGRLFRSEGLKVHGKVFAMLVTDRLVVKIPAAQATAVVAQGRAVPFESGGGRKMREWVALDVAERDAWPQLVADAFAYVESISRPG